MKIRAQLSLLFCIVFLLAACNTVAEPIVEAEDVATAEPATIDQGSADEVEEETVTPLEATESLAAADIPVVATPSEADSEPNEESEPENEQSTGKTGDLTVGDVIIAGAEGFPLYGTFQTTATVQRAPTILLLHMLNSNRLVWDEFALALNGAGFNTLALDMRGHGDTGGAKDWELAEADLILVWQYLAERPDVDETRIAIIGGSIGANMALITGANLPQVSTVVLLSPGLDYRGVKTEDAMQEYGERPILIIASNEDSYAADSSVALADLAVNNESQLHLYDGAGHGTQMFNRTDDLTQRLLDWLSLYLQ